MLDPWLPVDSMGGTCQREKKHYMVAFIHTYAEFRVSIMERIKEEKVNERK